MFLDKIMDETDENKYNIFLAKRVIIETISKYRYTGVILSVSNFGIIIKDKFDKLISLSFDNIIRIEEVEKW